jgi:plastocyanin
MKTMYALVSLLAGLAASALAATIVVNAGENGFTYTPNTLTASVGDMVEFHFFTGFHTAVQGDFDTPCAQGSLSATGFDSGPTTNVRPISCVFSSNLIVVNPC